jgi:hypothetical protein
MIISTTLEIIGDDGSLLAKDVIRTKVDTLQNLATPLLAHSFLLCKDMKASVLRQVKATQIAEHAPARRTK